MEHRPGRDVHLAMQRFIHLIMAVAMATGVAEAQETLSESSRVSGIHVSRLGDPAERATSQFPAGTAGVKCTFEVSRLPRGSRVELHWFRGDAELTISDFGAVEGSSELSSRLESDSALESGHYRAEIWIDEVPEGRTGFSIDGGEQERERHTRRGEPPRVSHVVLSTNECSGTAPTPDSDPASFDGFVEVVSLCLQYENMSPSRPLQVRWYDDASPRRPMTVSTFNPDGSGELSASYLAEGPMQPGSYHVVVALGNRPLESTSFVIEP